MAGLYSTARDTGAGFASSLGPSAHVPQSNPRPLIACAVDIASLRDHTSLGPVPQFVGDSLDLWGYLQGGRPGRVGETAEPLFR